MGCKACTEVEENYLDLESSAGLMYSVGEVVRVQAEKAHGPVRVHNFSLARRRRDSDMRSASSSTGSGSSSIETGTLGEDEKQQPSDEQVEGVPGSPAEPASGDSDGEAKTAGGKQPGRLYNITAVVDWTTTPDAKDALADMDMLRLLDDECRELRAHLRSRAMRDLISKYLDYKDRKK